LQTVFSVIPTSAPLPVIKKGYSIVRQKCILLNSREYFPSETGKSSSNEEFIHTSSHGAALPVIVITSPGLTTSGSTVQF